jgi:hypothetical protein
VQEREQLYLVNVVTLATGQANAWQRAARSEAHVERRWRTACHANRNTVFYFYFRVALLIACESAKPLLCALHSCVCVLCGLLFPCVIAYECGKQLLFVRGVF